MGCQASKSVPFNSKASNSVGKSTGKDLPTEKRASNEAISATMKSSPAPSEQTTSNQEDHDQLQTKSDNPEKQTQAPSTVVSTESEPHESMEEQLQQLPDGSNESTKTNTEASAADEVNPSDEWHHSIKVDQLALKLQFLSTDWADTKDHVHYQE